MPTPRLTAAAATAAVAVTLLAPALAVADASPPETRQSSIAPQSGHLSAIGLTTDQRLVEFPVHAPSRAWSLGRVTGLAGDTKLVGIDFRVQNERLYGVGNRGGVYTLSTRNAKAPP
ncbi:DUF4394 domain-containing protein [Streptomyces sp. NPDC058685]|uniref:DUF4394 domain-containing protein n=1 Tax=Streptomyces sp. NPDC058685 TaxID=3346598 RepID=UPI00365F4DBF